MLMDFELGIKPAGEMGREGDSYYFVCQNDSILWPGNEGTLEPLAPRHWQALGIDFQVIQYIGALAGNPCYLVETAVEQPAPVGYAWVSLRQILMLASEDLFAFAGRARQIAYFYRTNRYCGECGGRTRPHRGELLLECDACGHQHYPRISPCMIVLVTRGEEVLLASGIKHRPGLYSTLAGFIEAGENAEQAVHREVMEEVGIEVEGLEYIASQAWSFPHQLMLGYHARYKSGEIRIEPEEIEDAQWWHYRDLPMHPSIQTIAGRLIQEFIDRQED